MPYCDFAIDEALAEMPAAVAKGAALLDTLEPGWAARMRHKPEMDSFCGCVLGQVLGGYSDGRDCLAAKAGAPADEAWAEAHGFIRPWPCAEYISDAADRRLWARLESLWYKAIRDRLPAGKKRLPSGTWGTC